MRTHLKMLATAFMLGLMLTGIAMAGTTNQARAAQGAAITCAPAIPPAASPAASLAVAPAVAATPAAFPAEGGDFTIFAAASLTGAFEEIKAELEAAHPDLTITLNFAGSQTLVTQLAEGAEADVVALASTRQMDQAIDQGVIAGEPAIFARNQLAIVVPVDNPAGIESPADLAQDDLTLVLAAPEVPVGQYAREAICAMGRDPATYGDGFVAQVAASVVSEEQDVKAVLTKVLLGEADAGIVYTSDAVDTPAGEVTLIEIPPAVNVVPTYPVAAVAGGDPALAAAFIAYLLGPEGQATLEKYGFSPVA